MYFPLKCAEINFRCPEKIAGSQDIFSGKISWLLLTVNCLLKRGFAEDESYLGYVKKSVGHPIVVLKIELWSVDQGGLCKILGSL